MVFGSSTIYWVFEHFPTSHASLVRLKPGEVFPLARHWDATRTERLTIHQLLEYRTEVDCIRNGNILFQPFGMSMIVWEEVCEALKIS